MLKIHKVIQNSLNRIENNLIKIQEQQSESERRLTKLEDNNTWLIRAIIGQLITIILGYFFIKKG